MSTAPDLSRNPTITVSGLHSLTRSIAWSAAIALLGYLWAKKLYNRDPGK
ncbi:hypothetical protein [Nonomuraea endophytica]